MIATMSRTCRQAVDADLPAIAVLMERAIGTLQSTFLSPDQIAASRASMGLDTQLIADGTYFVVEQDGGLIGCGGWGKRATLYGGDHAAVRDDALLDPATDAARIRAMYTDPGHARRGIGREILQHCESAARAAGFTRVEMMATMAGEPLYAACGYTVVQRVERMSATGTPVPGAIMAKSL